MNKVIIILLLLSLGLFTGCAAVLIGAGVAGGIAISDDTVKTNVDTSFNSVWTNTVATLKNMGTVILEDKNHGKAEAMIEDSHAWINVKKLTEKATEIKIKVRKNLLPNIDLAHKISVNIVEKCN